MTVQRDRPYFGFNFLVDLGTGATDGPDAGFSECSEIGEAVTVVEYRTGNMRENEPQKLTGLSRPFDVTLRRGVIGSATLYAWLDQVRNGDEAAFRNVTIQLQNEDHSEVVMTWRLLRARAVRWAVGPLEALGSAITVEELTLAYERLELE
jgi:phage tail-like protein